MVAKTTITPGEVFSSLTVLGEVEKLKTGQVFKRAVEVRCICGHTFVVRYNAIKTGGTTSCGCMKRRFVTASNRDKYLKDLFEGTKLSRYDSMDILDGRDKVNLLCSCGCVWKKEFNLIVSRPVNCPDCIKEKKWQTRVDYKDRVIEKLKNSKLSLCAVPDGRLELFDNVFLECGINSCVFKRRVDVILSYDYSCPCQSSSGFKATNPAVLYLLELKDENDVVAAYKYGITNNFQQRLQQIKRKYPHTLETFYLWEYRYGSTANDHERTIKHSMVAVHDKSSMPDGYTETFGKDMLTAFLAIQQSQYEEEVYY